jgi:hypothetical protein
MRYKFKNDFFENKLKNELKSKYIKFEYFHSLVYLNSWQRAQ